MNADKKGDWILGIGNGVTHFAKFLIYQLIFICVHLWFKFYALASRSSFSSQTTSMPTSAGVIPGMRPA